MSIDVAALRKQRDALIRTVGEFVEYRGVEDTDTEILSELVEVLDSLLATAPGVFTWQIVVDTDYNDDRNGGVVHDEQFTGDSEGLEEHIVQVVRDTLVGVDDDPDGTGLPISTTISINWIRP